MKKLLLALLLPFMLLAACEDKLENEIEDQTTTDGLVNGLPVFKASTDGQGTKTSIDNDLNILWQEGDEVTIFAQNTTNVKYKVTGGGGTTSATLTPVTVTPTPAEGTKAETAAPAFNQNIAIYPYNNYINLHIAENKLQEVRSVNVPKIQRYVPDSYDPKAFIMYAISEGEDHNLKFKNLDGILEIVLTGTDKIRSVEVTGNNDEYISGDESTERSGTTLFYKDQDAMIIKDYMQKFAVVKSEEGVQLSNEPTTFKIVLHPTVFEHGFTITITDVAGNQMVKSTHNRQEIKRNEILSMPAFEYVPTPVTRPGLGEVWVKTVDGSRPEKCHSSYILSDTKNAQDYWVYTWSTNKTVLPEKSFDGYTDISEAWVGDGITAMNYSCFKGCENMTNIKLPDSFKVIQGNSAFANCKRLSSIVLPENFQAFGCKKDDGGYRLVSSVFEGCSALKSITIPRDVPFLGNFQFYGCTSLESIKLNEKLKMIGYGAFNGCTSLESIDLPASVTEINSQAFKGCTKLKHLNIPEDSQLETIGSDFLSGCTLETLTLNGKANLSERVFDECKLNTLIIAGETKLGEKALGNNKEIGSLKILHADGSWISDKFIQESATINMDLVLLQDWFNKTGKYKPSIFTNRWLGHEWESIQLCDDNGEIVQITEPEPQTDSQIWFKTIDNQRPADGDIQASYSVSKSVNGQGYWICYRKDQEPITEIEQTEPFKYPAEVKKKITEIILPSSFRILRNGTFDGWEQLSNIIFPDTSDEIKIQDPSEGPLPGLFNGTAFTTFTLPANFTLSDCVGAFVDCRNLEELTIYPSDLTGVSLIFGKKYSVPKLRKFSFLGKGLKVGYYNNYNEDILPEGKYCTLFYSHDNMVKGSDDSDGYNGYDENLKKVDLVINKDCGIDVVEKPDGTCTWLCQEWKSITKVTVDADGNVSNPVKVYPKEVQ